MNFIEAHAHPCAIGKQRLVICLDGTWNTKDDCTNILHTFNLVRDVITEDGVFQRKYYDEGVGTGVLDSVSGGGFGDGLEVNVREAYDWLVQYYNEGDEVFVFGFSRGAYTARSLVGLIARCGLLKRGAPLTVGQLWEGYGELQREKDHTESFWDRQLKKGAFRQLEKLKSDVGARKEWRATPENATEQLLIEWSRRIPITFLGIYDTVGAMGLDALAIPGLRGKAGVVHNMQPTSLIQRCCHALALDENRSGFNHTPILQWLGNDGPREKWEQETARWNGKYEQRWFTGAHSNVGGGYESNSLVMRPLEWMLEEAVKAGLACEVPRPGPAELPEPKDSYGEFAAPFWTCFFRGRRNYRLLAPPPELRARKSGGEWKPGFRLQPINESVDPSVWDYARANADYAPPALVAYAQHFAPDAGAVGDKIPAVARRTVAHEWPAKTAKGYWMLALWAILAGAGWSFANAIFLIEPERLVWIAALVAGLAAFNDWAESRLNLHLAIRRRESSETKADASSAKESALCDVIYWLRAFAVVLFVAGALGLVGNYFHTGWLATGGYREAIRGAWISLLEWWPLPAAVGAGALIATLWDRALGPVSGAGKSSDTPAACGRALTGTAAATTAILAACVALSCAGHLWWKVRSHLGDMPIPEPPVMAPTAIFAGHFLLLVVLLACFFNSFQWVGEPMGRANLGSMAQLMGWRKIAAVLNRWRESLRCQWAAEPTASTEAVRAVQHAVRQGLWRDSIGLIPMYSIALGFGLWFAAEDLRWAWLDEQYGCLPAWIWIVFVTALADEVEGFIHFSYLRRVNETGTEFLPPNAALVSFSGIVTLVKFAGFFTAGGTALAAFVMGGLRLFDPARTAGWRGFTGAAVMLLAAAVALWILYALAKAMRERRKAAQAK